ncbi:murein transglycosylase A [Gilliamella sp. B2776]|uniref:murein transglycosylase A n=1 Tax=unclassified Gilliamella TaxID=2685620 RepID=UPI00226A7BF1|nr:MULTISPECIES: murein transglycosylase A [unclassified Gilliamella]MCX8649346.1 murein transglycosylase A [Gilliamella sp. B2779]MCX8654793.1 murein transglycosylase A [Gilliamella sp. B2737]MCX8655813.1 murein transglycosylase A [Gilliamella sp. B2894]MCX8663916.1 murein transglycosylase A [Gilliamella sp. B2887]MCX8691159.1 murein transglycosylase A [Gilliamella sp. B2776]
MKQNNHCFYLSVLFILIILSVSTGCQSNLNKNTKQDQQYSDGKLLLPFNVSPTHLSYPVNISDYVIQIAKIESSSPELYRQNEHIYTAINNWITNLLDFDELLKVGLNSYGLAGQDGYGNVHFTGYYTPVIKARHTPTLEFKYPIYKMPAITKGQLPSREQIYNGALADKGLEIAYSNSLMDNFIMEVQGSAYIDFEDGNPLVFFSYAGKNGYSYSSIGQLLVKQGEIKKEELSMQAIKDWSENKSEENLKKLLIQNRSFVFFEPKYNAEVKGAASIPLIANASVASDKTLIPIGSVILADVPLLDQDGQHRGKRETRLMVALDVGGAIKGQHFDLYLGIGEKPGALAGFYNHYGRVWLIKP